MGEGGFGSVRLTAGAPSCRGIGHQNGAFTLHQSSEVALHACYVIIHGDVLVTFYLRLVVRTTLLEVWQTDGVPTQQTSTLYSMQVRALGIAVTVRERGAALKKRGMSEPAAGQPTAPSHSTPSRTPCPYF